MRTTFLTLLLLWGIANSFLSIAQTLPGDTLIYGPMVSLVYHDSVRVWVMTQNASGSGDTYTLELVSSSGGTPLTGVTKYSDTRLGYHLRSYEYAHLIQGQSYNVNIKKNGVLVSSRSKSFVHDVQPVKDFEFLAGGCGRIMDMTRCVDQIEGPKHVNGTPDIYKHMAGEGSELMVWLGDALYLFGIEHSDGKCPGMINDWDTQDALFSRYFFNRQFHDTLIRAMPQLNITDNHDMGGNEWEMTMPTIGISRQNFINWWANPEYKGTSQGPGLFSSYRKRDVEFFMLDNRDYRGSISQQLGTEQLTWLKQALLNSTAPFKVLVSQTPVFNKSWGGRNLSITAECDNLIQFIKANNIDGIIAYSADIHQQQFYGRYNDHTYPFFDVLSGNLASDIGFGNTVVTPDNDAIFNASVQTYVRNNVYGAAGNRRMKIDYVSPEGVVYYGTILHEDMLKSLDKNTLKISLSFANGLKDSSAYNRTITSQSTSFIPDRKNHVTSALNFNNNGGSVTIPYAEEIDMQDRAFSIACWVNPIKYPAAFAAFFSNAKNSKGFSLGIDQTGSPVYVDHAANKKYTSTLKLQKQTWTHVTWKYDNVKLQLSVYSNGQLIQKWSGVATPVSSDAGLTLGNNFENSYFTGAIDEVNVYGKLITDKLLEELSEYASSRGGALSLVGSQSTYLPSSTVNPLFSQSFTMEFWSRLTTAPASGAKLLSCNGRIAPNNYTSGFSLEFAADGKLNVAFGTNTANWLNLSENGNAWRVAEWNHVALTAVNNDSLYLYINGIKTGSVKFTQYMANTFNLGFGVSSVYGSPVQAEFDEFRLWSSPQSKDSILKRMHYELDGNEANLALYYDFSPFTSQSVKSKASNTYELTLVQAALVASSAPVARLAIPYRNEVKGNWSIRKEASAGLNVVDTVTAFTSNVVIGHHLDISSAPIATGSSVYYLKGGWQLNALDFPIGTLQLNLPACFPKYDSVAKIADEYYLLQHNDNTFQIVNTGYFDGTSIRFMHTYLDSGVYLLGWKADPTSRLFDRKGALSLKGNHAVHIPYSKITPALSGDFTIEFWSRVMEEPNGSIVSNHGRVSGNSTGLSFEFPGNRTFNAVLGNNGSQWNKITTKKDWNIGEWNHIAVTASPGGWMKLYCNGTAMDSSAFTQYFSNSIDFALGASINYNNQVISTLDEFRIWNKVRTNKEIQEHMHLSVTDADPALLFNYTFNNQDDGYAVNIGALKDSVTMTNAQLIPSTVPLGILAPAQQYHVTGDWSIRDTSNAGLSILASIADYETNLVMGSNDQSGSTISSTASDQQNLSTLWQIDALKLTQGTFVFSGLSILEEQWSVVKNTALEFYLLKADENGDLRIDAVGVLEDDDITFTSINLNYGVYTIGWKNSITGLIDMDNKSLRFYPNPTQDHLILSGLSEEVDQVFVHDINGKVITVPQTRNATELTIDTHTLQTGMYVIVLSGKKESDRQAMRFVKQ
ncbi:MAG: hypothetical protein JWO58_577 [Chitinophagaceae bacterium]|nr:hypothetical protein [Chitinophagaceae bacterium]